MKIKLALLYLRFKNNFIKNGHIWIVAAALLIGMLVAWLMTRETSAAAYYYIDTRGNQGVASACWENNSGLVCERAYGGKIAVDEYWRSQ